MGHWNMKEEVGSGVALITRTIHPKQVNGILKKIPGDPKTKQLYKIVTNEFLYSVSFRFVPVRY